MTLTEFLLARIADDEEDVLLTTHRLQQHGTPWHWRSRARQLADCEAKRRLLQGMQSGMIDDMFAPEILGLLALPYADHPDYRPEWRP